MDNNDIGSKIKYFRKRAGLSQLELEIETDSSAGSISRIEAGKVNPTKETLYLIADKLNLNSIESASLFNINYDYTQNVLDIINTFSQETDPEKMIQSALNQIAYKLDFISATIFLLNGNNLVAYAHSHHPLIIRAMSIINKPFKSLFINSDINSQNLLLRTALDNKINESETLYDFGQGAISQFIAKSITQMTSFKKGISIPLSIENKVYGTVFFAKKDVNDYKTEIQILISLTKQIAINIKRFNLNNLNSFEYHGQQ